MRKSNVDISKIPKFSSFDEAKNYFNRFGKLTFIGWEGRNKPYAVHTYKRKNGADYFVDIYENGEVAAVILRNVNHDF